MKRYDTVVAVHAHYKKDGRELVLWDIQDEFVLASRATKQELEEGRCGILTFWRETDADGFGYAESVGGERVYMNDFHYADGWGMDGRE